MNMGRATANSNGKSVMVFDDATYIGKDAREMVVLQFDACAFDVKDKVYVDFYECTCHGYFLSPLRGFC